jgi:uncharacterized membrane protein YgcG
MPKKDAIQVLEEDHVKVEKAFEQFEKLGEEDSEQKQQIVSTVLSDLKVHTVIEEELFYPRLLEATRGDEDVEDLLDEAEVEHTSAKEMIAQIEAMDPGERLYDAKFTVLCEYVKHHVKEERNEMFPKAKKSDLDLEAIGEELENRKMELKQMRADEEAGMSARKSSGGRRASGGSRSSGKSKSTGGASRSRSTQRKRS